MFIVAGLMNVAPSTGLVMAMVGGTSPKMPTDDDVFVAPRLSDAIAVRVCEPAARITERSYGLVATLPKEVAPSKNSTLVTVPSESSALAWMVTIAGATKMPPFPGLVMVTLGAALTVTVTVAEGDVAPASSEATALRVWVPADNVTGRLYGLDAAFPSEVAPSKNSTLVTVPSLSTALAMMLKPDGTVAPLSGLARNTQGGLFPTGGVERM